jgi:hypothetical protein
MASHGLALGWANCNDNRPNAAASRLLQGDAGKATGPPRNPKFEILSSKQTGKTTNCKFQTEPNAGRFGPLFAAFLPCSFEFASDLGFRNSDFCNLRDTGE